ncbi:MAG: 50S ribosomal protein L30 [Methanobacteriaceae archaeon]|nr:50S ribosomal protein L30 [Methanobacteriaceae archaeon]
MIAAIRVRGRTGINRDISETLDMLRLTRINHVVIIPENPSYKGMLQKAKDYLTWGEVTEETILALLENRGRLPGRKHLTEEYVSENTEYASITELAHALYESETTLKDNGLKPIFRLSPPRKGYEHTKRAFTEGGSLGYRAEDINALLSKMM